MVARPMELAGSDAQTLTVPENATTATLGHCPAFACRAVQRDVDGAVIFGINRCTMTRKRCCVVRRENASDKSDDTYRVLAVVADGIDIPPEIRTRPNRLVEARSAITVAAASWPDNAAIGTPGPGCTLPPAR